MQVFATDREQRQLAHEFFVLRAPVLRINEIEFLDIRCILDDST